MKESREEFHVAPEYQPVMRELGLDAEGIYTHPAIKVWRSISERENCTLDARLRDGRMIRLHIKRHHAAGGTTTPAEDEVRGIRALEAQDIATVKLAGWGRMIDGRSFIIIEDLGGYEAADKLLRRGVPFEQIGPAIAQLAGKLHACGLHHRDLYLCHFFVRPEPLDVRLIDAARVKRLPGWPMRNRWIVKDLAELWYSMIEAGTGDEDRMQMLRNYCEVARLDGVDEMRRRIEAKARRIARHDAKLKGRQPWRNISIPT